MRAIVYVPIVLRVPPEISTPWAAPDVDKLLAVIAIELDAVTLALSTQPLLLEPGPPVMSSVAVRLPAIKHAAATFTPPPPLAPVVVQVAKRTFPPVVKAEPMLTP